ncbi:MAG: succinate dehydrogenase, cytochrome b556 subunit [Gammaproteobacteria bacterium]|nr:succinate dehydrogenase, cytochrome b556 subunit [Gammaproteobacteria bacterium]
MTTARRPLSPHLQVYRPQLTSVLSILHRVTGVIIALSAILIGWWLWSVAGSEEQFSIAHGFFNSVFGTILLIIWTGCTFYHLCNGVRHLFWDIGVGFEISQAYRSGKLVVAASAILTLLAWLI